MTTRDAHQIPRSFRLERADVVFAVVMVAGLCAFGVLALWSELVRYRTEDGLAFSRDTNYRHILAGHRCSGAIYNWCFKHLPGEPRGNDTEHVPPVSLRGHCDNVAGALCYTALPVECATGNRKGVLDFEACDRVFPHGPKHTLELLLGRDLK